MLNIITADRITKQQTKKRNKWINMCKQLRKCFFYLGIFLSSFTLFRLFYQASPLFLFSKTLGSEFKSINVKNEYNELNFVILSICQVVLVYLFFFIVYKTKILSLFSRDVSKYRVIYFIFLHLNHKRCIYVI